MPPSSPRLPPLPTALYLLQPSQYVLIIIDRHSTFDSDTTFHVSLTFDVDAILSTSPLPATIEMLPIPTTIRMSPEAAATIRTSSLPCSPDLSLTRRVKRFLTAFDVWWMLEEEWDLKLMVQVQALVNFLELKILAEYIDPCLMENDGVTFQPRFLATTKTVDALRTGPSAMKAMQKATYPSFVFVVNSYIHSYVMADCVHRPKKSSSEYWEQPVIFFKLSFTFTPQQVWKFELSTFSNVLK
uniref:Uncharacterized protein n=1 Tax=Cucumis melo TaxID=3656 RepID=A0A9I9E728_CUCME